ncbi:hypothetical protein LV716_14700 [Flagellimonas sp. HMM57]|uniref:hypothetical protein n=1 Tax=unclassified Flagellimonas TaxID=2644544 RepID=UPI0013D178B8|nr:MULTISPECIES: hypothetical protein [unclassified Flagellimonas]UII75496.1 hypothetical protein LV716_14700 [Flagellimonas sp. HMM57]
MNRALLIAFVFLLGTNWFYAQRPAKDRIKTLKVAYLTEQLSLTKEEAQEFWPVYNAHEEVMDNIRKKERQHFGNRFDNISELSESEADKIIEQFIKLQAEKHKIEQDFIKDLQSVIPSKKVILLFRAERSFKKRLIQQYRKRKEGG